MKRNHSACLLALTASTLFVNVAQAGGRIDWKNLGLYDPNPESLTITNSVSDVQGHIGGYVCRDGTVSSDPNYTTACGGYPNIKDILYPISGPTYATVVYPGDGVTVGTYTRVGTVNAMPAFDVSFFGLTNPDWSSLPSTLPWTMREFQMSNGGSLFEITEGMELTGRAFTGVGQAQDPAVTGKLSLRMAGCAGVREISGEGKYAGTVGTLCLNGTFIFDPDFNGKGVSNCTIVLHKPVASTTP